MLFIQEEAKVKLFKKNVFYKKLFNQIPEKSKFYFLHKYHCIIDDESVLRLYSKFEKKDVVSVIYKNNILGTQFHPELSGEAGEKFLTNFYNIDLKI